MKSFLAIFKCAENSKAHHEWMKLTPAMKNERMEKGEKSLQQWLAKYNDKIIYDGGHLDEVAKFVDNTGISDIASTMGSFMVVKAESYTEAAEMFSHHPHFACFPGDGVEVIEQRNRHE